MLPDPLQIVYYNDPRLREKCAPVEFPDPDLAPAVEKMAELMYANKGIGIAASQVGILKRFFLWDTAWAESDDDGKKIGERKLNVCVNPEILEESDDDEGMVEGCLSLPQIEGEVFRPTTITLRSQNLRGEWREDRLEGLDARVAQHELDHLDGVLFIDRMPFLKRATLAGALGKLKKETQG